MENTTTDIWGARVSDSQNSKRGSFLKRSDIKVAGACLAFGLAAYDVCVGLIDPAEIQQTITNFVALSAIYLWAEVCLLQFLKFKEKQTIKDFTSKNFLEKRIVHEPKTITGLEEPNEKNAEEKKAAKNVRNIYALFTSMLITAAAGTACVPLNNLQGPEKGRIFAVVASGLLFTPMLFRSVSGFLRFRNIVNGKYQLIDPPASTASAPLLRRKESWRNILYRSLLG